MGSAKKLRPQYDMFADTELVNNTKFWEYHNKYPQVYNYFKQLTLEAIEQKKYKHFSARGIFQVMRFFRKDGIKADGFKYNNNNTPYYVRMFEVEFPKYKGFFEKRKTKFSVV
jgi:hypothetical protein